MVREEKKKMKKKMGAKKDFDEEAHYQGSKKVPMKEEKEYGTGVREKKAMSKMAKKKK